RCERGPGIGGPQRLRRGAGSSALPGRAGLRALLAGRRRWTGLGPRPRDRARDSGTARRPRLRGGSGLHDRAAGSQRSLRVRRYNERWTARERNAVKLLRTLSTPRLAMLLAGVVALVVVAASVAVAASGGGGPTPPPKPL